MRARDINPNGQGIRFWFEPSHPDATNDDEEMTYATLAYCVRHSTTFGFEDGQTIAEASSQSDWELWTDVICPAIERGEITVTSWGTELEFDKR